ncbi:MAG: hypothetical protein M1837_002821 [Sclerophora amabilis]|nr:MAG: hypothetical protein M1837_002821 [Sclerophora amabilis]
MSEVPTPNQQAEQATVVDGRAPPPSYEEHHLDTTAGPSDQKEAPRTSTALHRAPSPQPASGSRHQQVWDPSEAGQDVPPIVSLPPGPLSLTYDQDLIYPTHPPSTALYHIPSSLFSKGHRVMIERSVPASLRDDGSKRKARDQELYEILASSALSNDCEIQGRRKECYRHASMTGRFGMFGPAFSISVRGAVILKLSKREWKDGNDRVVATEAKKGPGNAEIEIVEGLDEKMVDLLVAAWCAKIWRMSFHRDSKLFLPTIKLPSYPDLSAP